MNDVDIDIAREEGQNNRTVIFTFYSKKDKGVVSHEGFPYEIKDDTLYYFDYEKKEAGQILLKNLKSVKETGKPNTEASCPCSL
jgi:hypothetical protein